MKEKIIWSSRYGKNPAEGIHKWLEHNVRGYKRGRLSEYINGLNVHLGKPDRANDIKLAHNNFVKWTKFVREKFSGEMIPSKARQPKD